MVTPAAEVRDSVASEENQLQNEENVAPNNGDVASQLICKKCNKIYKTKKYLASHEVKCDGIDKLTCPRCMLSFATRQAKSKHILNKKCTTKYSLCKKTEDGEYNKYKYPE